MHYNLKAARFLGADPRGGAPSVPLFSEGTSIYCSLLKTLHMHRKQLAFISYISCYLVVGNYRLLKDGRGRS